MSKHVMTREHKQMARNLKAKGLNVKEIARAIDVHFHMADLTVYKKQPRTRKSLGWEPAPGCLSAEEREDILNGALCPVHSHDDGTPLRVRMT